MYEQISPNIFNCQTCPTRCDGVSKEKYFFEKDSAFSEKYEQQLIEYINQYTPFSAVKTEQEGYPDIEVFNKGESNPALYLEIKVQRRTFMGVEKILPDSGLKPSETLALNLSDLLRYFKLQENTEVPVFIMWCLLNRPCINGKDDVKYFYQSVNLLKPVYEEALDKRRFRRESGLGDVVDCEHKGVVVNYHFSINELKEWKPENASPFGT